ncbi:hypothetical protein BDZ91DRAFT_159301 [Kalaharituber pfeilii]|nr:hypothetical protein BDZ91DRAFT_159301 [Kalaharituber pfeilii]
MLTKLGEASYSEVFLQKPKSPTPTSPNTVLKIIPFGKQSQCLFSHIYEEILITRTMSPLKGYIGFHGAHVCRGKFPKKLLELWDHWDENVKVSENDRPDFYEEDQLFAVIGLEDGGTDLESFKVGGWREARQIFWAVAGRLKGGRWRGSLSIGICISEISSSDMFPLIPLPSNCSAIFPWATPQPLQEGGVRNPRPRSNLSSNHEGNPASKFLLSTIPSPAPGARMVFCLSHRWTIKRCLKGRATTSLISTDTCAPSSSPILPHHPLTLPPASPTSTGPYTTPRPMYTGSTTY